MPRQKVSQDRKPQQTKETQAEAAGETLGEALKVKVVSPPRQRVAPFNSIETICQLAPPKFGTMTDHTTHSSAGRVIETLLLLVLLKTTLRIGIKKALDSHIV